MIGNNQQDQKKRLTAFSPIIGINPKVLILGSMPSVKSLAKHQYYGHPRNGFWPIICSLIEQPITDNYEQRTAYIEQSPFIVWDVLASCEREGSLDSAIQAEVVNDFETLFETYPTLEAICFNGQTAYKLYKRHIGIKTYDVSIHILPSTSPAYVKPLEEKKKEWAVLKKFL